MVSFYEGHGNWEEHGNGERHGGGGGRWVWSRGREAINGECLLHEGEEMPSNEL